MKAHTSAGGVEATQFYILLSKVMYGAKLKALYYSII